MVNETTLSKDWTAELESSLSAYRKNLTIFRHVEQYTHGVPDRSVTLGNRTVWIEFKALEFNQPSKFKYRPGQIITLPKLANCFVVVFVRKDDRLFDCLCFKPVREGLLTGEQLKARIRPLAGRFSTKAVCFSDSILSVRSEIF